MNRRIALYLLILFVFVGVTALLYGAEISEKKEIQKEALLMVKFGDTTHVLALETIRSLKEESFQAMVRSSSLTTTEHTYLGVPLSSVVALVGVPLKEENQVLVKAVDGYMVAFTGKEALEAENLYLVYRQDGKELGTKEEGGSGPYMVVVRKDPFSQRWCKFVMEVEIR